MLVAGEEPVDEGVLAAAVDLPGRGLRPGCGRLRTGAQVPALDGAGVPAPARSPHRFAQRLRDGGPHAARHGPRRHLRPARGWVRPLLRGCGLGGAALREDALRQRAAARRLHPLVAAERRPAGRPGGPRDRRLPAPGAAHRAGRLRLGAGRRHRGRRGPVLRLDPGPAGRGARPRGRRLGREPALGHAGRHLRARCLHAAAARRQRRPAALGGGPLRLAEAREQRVRPARDDKVVAAWNGLVVASLAEAGTLLGEPRYVEAAADAAQLLLDVHLDGGDLRRVSRDGVAGRHAGVLEDYACVAAGVLALLSATSDPRWLRTAGVLLDEALGRFAADDGGFHDTAADAEVLVARPRDPSDNASPSGLSALVHALLTYAAVTGSGRHRDAAEAALRTVPAAGRAGAALRRLVAGRGRGRGRRAAWRWPSSARPATRHGRPWSGSPAAHPAPVSWWSSASPRRPRGAERGAAAAGRGLVEGRAAGLRVPGHGLRPPGHRCRRAGAPCSGPDSRWSRCDRSPGRGASAASLKTRLLALGRSETLLRRGEGPRRPGTGVPGRGRRPSVPRRHRRAGRGHGVWTAPLKVRRRGRCQVRAPTVGAEQAGADEDALGVAPGRRRRGRGHRGGRRESRRVRAGRGGRCRRRAPVVSSTARPTVVPARSVQGRPETISTAVTPAAASTKTGHRSGRRPDGRADGAGGRGHGPGQDAPVRSVRTRARAEETRSRCAAARSCTAPRRRRRSRWPRRHR